MAERIYGPEAFAGGTLNIDHRLKSRAGRSYGVQLNYDGALTTSAINVSFSNDGTNWIPYPSDQITIVQPPAGGAERTTGINFSYVGYEWVRVQLVHSAGSPTLEALLGAQA